MQDSAKAGTLVDGLDAAGAAVASGDLAPALMLFAELRGRFPKSPEPFQRAAFALVESRQFDEAEQLLKTAMERFPANAGMAIDYAWVAHRRRDVAEAGTRWEKVRQLFPDHPTGFTGGSVTLREAGQLDAAQALLTQAEVRFPNELSLLVEQAWMALAQRDLPVAIQRWAQVRLREPDLWLGYTGGSAALRDAQRFEEAETLLGEAVVRFPDAPQASVDYAHLAAVRRDWPESLLRWQTVAAQFPNRIEGYTGQALALRELGRLPEAEAVLRRASDRCPARREILIDLAWSVTHQHRHDDAIELWEQVRMRFPEYVGGFNGGAVALGNAGRVAEATAMLDRATDRFPDNPGPPTERGWLAMNQRDYVAAERAFTAVRKRFPDQLAADLGLGRALRAQGRLDEATALVREAVVRYPAFGLLASDLAELAPQPVAVADAPVVVQAPAAPIIARSGPLKLAVTGFHLASQIAQIFSRLAPLRDKVVVEQLNVGTGVDAIRMKLPDRWLDTADLYFEESQVGSAQVKGGLRSLLPAFCVVRTFPTSGSYSLWPFRGRDERMAPEPPAYNSGRYSYTDSIAASLAGTTMTDDALFDAYLELTESAPIDLDRAYATDLMQ